MAPTVTASWSSRHSWRPDQTRLLRLQAGRRMVQDSCRPGPAPSIADQVCLEAEAEAEAQADAAAVSPVQQSIESYGGGR